MYGTQANLLLLPCPTVNRHPVLRRAGQPRAQKPCPEGLATPPAELPGPAEVLAEVRMGWGPSSTRIMKVEVCLIHFSFLSSSNQQLGLEGVSRAWTQLSWILRPRLPTSPPFPNPLSQGQAGPCLQPPATPLCSLHPQVSPAHSRLKSPRQCT